MTSCLSARSAPSGTRREGGIPHNDPNSSVPAWKPICGSCIERLGAVNLRLPGDASEPGVDLDSQLAEMVALRDEGKIGGIGISNVTVEQLRQALPVGLVYAPHSVLDRSGEPLSTVPGA